MLMLISRRMVWPKLLTQYVSGIVGIGVGQTGFQYWIPSCRIGQMYFDLKTEFVEIVIIVRGRDGKRDGSRVYQGGLKRYVP